MQPFGPDLCISAAFLSHFEAEDWYKAHGGKELRKEMRRANAPAFVRYSADGPVMPGSLRVPKTPTEKKAGALSPKKEQPPTLPRVVSSPALVVSRRQKAAKGLFD